MIPQAYLPEGYQLGYLGCMLMCCAAAFVFVSIDVKRGIALTSAQTQREQEEVEEREDVQDRERGTERDEFLQARDPLATA